MAAWPPETQKAATDLVELLQPYLALSTKCRYAIRSPQDFRTAATDRTEQVVALIDHLFVRYPVPRFLYRVMLSEKGIGQVFPQTAYSTPQGSKRLEHEAKYRQWFYAIAQGRPLAPLVKDHLSRKEANWFVQAPDHLQIPEAFVWAKAAALGVPPEGCTYLLTKFGLYHLKGMRDRQAEVFRYYARTWTEMTPEERDGIADFVRWQIEETGFSLTGRTLNSVKDLNERWHRAMYLSEIVELFEWKPAYKPWEVASASTTVRAVELTSTTDLADEGYEQRHCVYSYAYECRDGRSRIVSFRWFDRDEKEVDRITIEVDVARRKVVQIRGRLNRATSEDEMIVVSAWADGQRLEIAEYA